MSDFLLDSDYNTEKIVKMIRGSVIAHPMGVIPTAQHFAHGLGYAPLDITVFSDTPDFKVVKNSGYQAYAPLNKQISLDASTNSKDLIIFPGNETQNQTTLYFRTLLFQPPNIDLNADFTNVQADAFVINSDYNYLKIFKEGFVTQATVIPHNLGFTPFVRVWREWDPFNSTEPENELYFQDFSDDRAFLVDNNNLYINQTIFDGGQFRANKVFYRIYLDD